MQSDSSARLARLLSWLGALLLLSTAGAAVAQDAADPPARVAHVSQRQGSVVFAPQGEEDWVELPQNRPLTEGDRLWTDNGARAELQLGTATVHVNGETHLGVSNLDERAAQFMLQQGTVNARVRELVQGENFEIGTPNLAFRALQPGEYRIDIDPQTQQTHVVVVSGTAAIYGEGGEAIHMGAGQVATFAGRFLAEMKGPGLVSDEFARWAAERNRQEDRAVAARPVPRGVVGASELDGYGNWNQDPTYGTVWVPSVTVANWAPYRYGHWSWIAPWGWTWIDDAPWGFAPFHYGRWAMIGNRWAWVPGQMAARPVYSPALVVFLGGGGSQFAFSTGPAVGWYPLAPGEAWYPWYRASPRYVSYANYRINLNAWPRNASNHLWRQRSFAVTAVREDDFRRGRSVERNWQPVQPQMIDRARINVVPVRPDGRMLREGNVSQRARTPVPSSVQSTGGQRFFGGAQAPSPRFSAQAQGLPPAVSEQYRAQREQDRLQRQAEHDAREQVRQQYDNRTQQQQQRDAGRVVDPGTSQRDAGRVDPGGSQRNAGRVTIDRGGEFERARPADAPRYQRQGQPHAVPVPRQEAVPIGEQRGDEGRGRGHWGR